MRDPVIPNLDAVMAIWATVTSRFHPQPRCHTVYSNLQMGDVKTEVTFVYSLHSILLSIALPIVQLFCIKLIELHPNILE